MMIFQRWVKPKKSVRNVYSIGYIVYIIYILIGILLLYITNLTYNFTKNAENTFKSSRLDKRIEYAQKVSYSSD